MIPTNELQLLVKVLALTALVLSGVDLFVTKGVGKLTVIGVMFTALAVLLS
jgi:hypothetical protein